MKQFLLMLLTLSFISCKNSKPFSLSHVLSSECFWDRTDERQVIGGLNSCYRFLPDGSCFFYYYIFYDKKLTDSVHLADDDDVIVPATWNTIGDSILVARGIPYKVLSFTQYSVTIEINANNRHGYMKDTIVLRKNCNTIIEK